MAGELTFSHKDLYPNMSGFTTTDLTAPEADDQKTLVDDQKLAVASPQVTDEQHRNIWTSIGIVGALVLFLAFLR